MFTIALLENEASKHLFPFTLIRSLLDLRVGIFTLREKWVQLLGTEPILHGETVHPSSAAAEYLTATIPWNLVPIDPLPDHIEQLQTWIQLQPKLDRPWQIPGLNLSSIRRDFRWIKQTQQSAGNFGNATCTDPENIFIEPGARIEHCILNASEGPIYIGRNAIIMDGAILRGPIAVCEGAVIKMGARIYGGTTIGPYSIAGGEIKNSMIMGYSNKAHDGYLGDAVIGEWCNLGAGTSCSNLKNSGQPVEVWNNYLQKAEQAGQKCGVVMGDYSRSAINTSFNTGTLTGICCNIFGDGRLTPTFIPNFSWGQEGREKYQFSKALYDIKKWMSFKQKTLDGKDEKILQDIYLNSNPDQL